MDRVVIAVAIGLAVSCSSPSIHATAERELTLQTGAFPGLTDAPFTATSTRVNGYLSPWWFEATLDDQLEWPRVQLHRLAPPNWDAFSAPSFCGERMAYWSVSNNTILVAHVADLVDPRRHESASYGVFEIPGSDMGWGVQPPAWTPDCAAATFHHEPSEPLTMRPASAAPRSAAVRPPDVADPPADSFRISAQWFRVDRTEEVLPGAEVTQGFFDAVRVNPLLGRLFVAEEFTQHAPVIILHHELWKSRFGGMASVVGRRVTIHDQEFTVVGVMPLGFNVPAGVLYWRPMANPRQ